MKEQQLQEIEARCRAAHDVGECGSREESVFHAHATGDMLALIAALREAWVKHDELVAACEQATIQIQYLHDKFQETGSGNQCLAQLSAARKSKQV